MTACLTPGLGWLVCGVGALVGGAGIVASETDRWREIAKEEREADLVGMKADRAEAKVYDAIEDANDCIAHALKAALEG